MPFTAPRNPVEEVVHEVWGEVLGTSEPFGVHHNFFDLGGNSLLAARILVRLREALRVELPLVTFIESATIAELAEALAEAEPRPGQVEKIARLCRKVWSLSPEELRRQLAAKQAAGRQMTKEPSERSSQQ